MNDTTINLEISELSGYMQEFTQSEWEEHILSEAEMDWKVKNIWKPQPNIVIMEWRNSRNHLSVTLHAHNEAASRENALSIQDQLLVAFTILNNAEGTES